MLKIYCYDCGDWNSWNETDTKLNQNDFMHECFQNDLDPIKAIETLFKLNVIDKETYWNIKSKIGEKKMTKKFCDICGLEITGNYNCGGEGNFGLDNRKFHLEIKEFNSSVKQDICNHCTTEVRIALRDRLK